ncbi:MAG: hypothetical protein HY560_11370, partial [Gemmatimonadetes bacterium]|nr:hypothetical protein [Gemmatimonadota bacterium]
MRRKQEGRRRPHFSLPLWLRPPPAFLRVARLFDRPAFRRGLRPRLFSARLDTRFLARLRPAFGRALPHLRPLALADRGALRLRARPLALDDPGALHLAGTLRLPL